MCQGIWKYLLWKKSRAVLLVSGRTALLLSPWACRRVFQSLIPTLSCWAKRRIFRSFLGIGRCFAYGSAWQEGIRLWRRFRALRLKHDFLCEWWGTRHDKTLARHDHTGYPWMGGQIATPYALWVITDRWVIGPPIIFSCWHSVKCWSRKCFTWNIFCSDFFAFFRVFCIGCSNRGADNTAKIPIFFSTNRVTWI